VKAIAHKATPLAHVDSQVIKGAFLFDVTLKNNAYFSMLIQTAKRYILLQYYADPNETMQRETPLPEDRTCTNYLPGLIYHLLNGLPTLFTNVLKNCAVH